MITLTIPGDPFPWQRPGQSGRVRFTTPAMKASKEEIGYIARPLFKEPWNGPMQVDYFFSIAMPKSWSAKKRKMLNCQFHTQRVDADNLQKQINDALNGIAWEDDGQVAAGSFRKIWGETGQTVITITDLMPGATRF